MFRRAFFLVSILTLFVCITLLIACKENRQNNAVLFQNYYGKEQNQPGGTLFIAQDGDSIEDYSFGLADLEKKKSNSSEIKYRMASVSKHFTAFAIYELIQRGELDLETRVTDILEGMDPVYNKVTLGEILNHTSGIWDYEDLIPEDQTEQLSDADVFDLIKDKKDTYFEPGTAFRYSNTGFCLLTLVVEEKSGMPYADFMKQQLFEPIDLDARVYQKDNPPLIRAFGYHPREKDTFLFADQSLTSATKGDGGIYISPEQFAKWSSYLMNKINENDTYATILSQNRQEVAKGVDYSMGWFILNDQDENMLLVHSGETTGFNNIVVLNPKERKSISLFTNRDDLKIAPAFDQILKQQSQKFKPSRTSLFRFLAQVYAHEED